MQLVWVTCDCSLARRVALEGYDRRSLEVPAGHAAGGRRRVGAAGRSADHPLYRGVLGAGATANLFVNVGSFVQVAPTVSRGCDFVADQPGLWVVYPISWGQAAVRYEGS